jgi:hypothetical protein
VLLAFPFALYTFGFFNFCFFKKLSLTNPNLVCYTQLHQKKLLMIHNASALSIGRSAGFSHNEMSHYEKSYTETGT